MLTIAEIAKRHGLPESTARYYCKRFRNFLPHVGEGKRRRYLPEALPVFSAILEAMAENKNAIHVEAVLDQKFARIGARDRTPAAARATLPPAAQSQGSVQQLEVLMQRQTAALEDIADCLRRLLEGVPQQHAASQPAPQQERLQAVERQIADMQQQLHSEIKSLGSLQDQAERIHQQDMEQLRKWLAHLAKEQAKSAKPGEPQ